LFFDDLYYGFIFKSIFFLNNKEVEGHEDEDYSNQSNEPKQ